MTDPDKNRILEACGFVEHSYRESLYENYWTKDNICRGTNPEPTMQERWEALCRVCRKDETTPVYRPFLAADTGVVLYSPAHLLSIDDGILVVDMSGPGPDDYREAPLFSCKEYGSLNGAIDAAIIFVLDRKEGGE